MKYMLDSNCFDKVLELGINLPSFVNRYIGETKIIVTHIQYDEIYRIPDNRMDYKFDLLALFNDLSCEVVETEGFVQDTSRLGLAKLFSNDNLEKFLLLAKNENHINDSLIAVTSNFHKATLVTADVFLLKNCKEAGIEAIHWDKFINLHPI